MHIIFMETAIQAPINILCRVLRAAVNDHGFAVAKDDGAVPLADIQDKDIYSSMVAYGERWG